MEKKVRPVDCILSKILCMLHSWQDIVMECFSSHLLDVLLRISQQYLSLQYPRALGRHLLPHESRQLVDDRLFESQNLWTLQTSQFYESSHSLALKVEKVEKVENVEKVDCTNDLYMRPSSDFEMNDNCQSKCKRSIFPSCVFVWRLQKKKKDPMCAWRACDKTYRGGLDSYFIDGEKQSWCGGNECSLPWVRLWHIGCAQNGFHSFVFAHG